MARKLKGTTNSRFFATIRSNRSDICEPSWASGLLSPTRPRTLAPAGITRADVTETACITRADTLWSGCVSDANEDVSITGTVVSAARASFAANHGVSGNTPTAATNQLHLTPQIP